MPLKELDLAIRPAELPATVSRFLREADARIDQFLRSRGTDADGFVASDYVTVYWALRAIVDARLNTGHSFCEWGSGFGIAASLACMLEMNASGIEINRTLVDAARLLADDFGLPVEFVHGSFVPPGGDRMAEEALAETVDDIFFLETSSNDAYEQLGLDLDDFDIVFAYPWPAEQLALDRLFERFAADKALLVTYGHADTIRLQQKQGRR